MGKRHGIYYLLAGLWSGVGVVEGIPSFVVEEPAVDSVPAHPVITRPERSIIGELSSEYQIYTERNAVTVRKLIEGKKETVMCAVAAVEAGTSCIFKSDMEIRNIIIGTSLRNKEIRKKM